MIMKMRRIDVVQSHYNTFAVLNPGVGKNVSEVGHSFQNKKICNLKSELVSLVLYFTYFLIVSLLFIIQILLKEFEISLILLLLLTNKYKIMYA